MDFDAYEHEMGWKRMSDEEAERILAGLEGDRRLEGFADDVRLAYTSAPDEATRTRHLAAIAESARLLAPRGEQTTERAAAHPTLLRRWKLVLSEVFAGAVAKIALSGVALAATTGGLAATGNLPDPAQSALAKAAEKAGVEIPSGGAEDDAFQAQTPTAGLPDQAGEVAKRVHAVIDGWEGERGCEFGQAVAAAARGDDEPKECHAGKPEETGKPADAGSKAKEAGKPDDTGKPADAGKAESTGKPADAGTKSEGAGKPDDAGKPDEANKPSEAGSQGGAKAPSGPPEDAGKPTDKGKP